MPLFGNVLRNIRRSADELLTSKGTIQTTFAVDNAQDEMVILEESEMPDFVKTAKGYQVVDDGETTETPAEIFRRSVVTRDGRVSFKTKEGFEISVPTNEWEDFLEGLAELNDSMVAARRRIDAGEQPIAAAPRTRSTPAKATSSSERKARAPVPRHELEALSDDAKSKLVEVLGEGEDKGQSLSTVHKAALAAGIYPDPAKTSGLALAQKNQLRQFLQSDDRVVKLDTPGQRGPEAAKWYRKMDPEGKGKGRRKKEE